MSHPERGSGASLDPHVVESDSYDRAAIVRLRRGSQAWRTLDEEGSRLVPHFPALVEDLFCALFKYNVVLLPPERTAASTAFNRRVLAGVATGPAWEMLRLHTILDEARAGLGAVLVGEAVLRALREDRVLTSGDLLDLWNLEREEANAEEAQREAEVGRELAEELARGDEPQAAEDEAAEADGDEQTEDAPAGEADESGEGEPSDAEEGARSRTTARRRRRAASAAARAMREAALKAKLSAHGVAAQREQKRRRVERALDRVAKRLDEKLFNAAAQASSRVADLQDALAAWGRGIGAGGPRDPGQSIDLGRRLADNAKMRRLFQVFGRMREQALAVRRRALDRTDEELYEIRQGRGLEDVGRLIPHELMALSHPLLRRDFLRRLLDGGVLTYSLRGLDQRGHGPMVICLDTSSSMAGEKEIWSKAVTLTFVELARRRRRRCHVVCFSSGERGLRDFDMNPGASWSVALERTLDLAEHFPGGGTDYMAPLDAAVARLAERDMRRGDIVLITDGECEVDPEWRERFLELKRKKNFALYSILIDVASARTETVRALSDRVSLVSDLRADTRHLFAELKPRRRAA
ncbi:MAG TPA: VWA domain-containing protein [Candidatus Binatia bacterium]